MFETRIPQGGRRRLLAVGALLAGTALALVGCVPGGAGPQSDELGAKPAELSGKVEFWTINLRSAVPDYIQGLIDSFEAENPKVTVEWVDVPGDEITTKFLTALSSGDVPDVVNLFSYDIPGASSRLLDLRKVFSEEAVADIQPGLRDPFVYDGALAATPWYNGGALISIYRKSIMSQVPGFDPENPPANYDELLKLAGEVHDATGKWGANIYPSYEIFRYDGIEMLNADKTKAAFDTPEGVALLERWKAAYDSGALAPGAASQQGIPPQWIDSGETGFIVNYASVITNLKENAPDAYQDLEISAAPRDVNGKYLLSDLQTLAIPAASKNPWAAGAFLEFITNAENQLALCKLAPIYPSSVKAGADPYFTEVDTSTIEGRARQLTASVMPDLVYTGAFGTTSDSALITAFDGLRDFLPTQESAADALSAVAKKWDEILAGG